MVKKLTVSDDAYWKLLEVKVRLRCESWDDFADKVYKILGVGEHEHSR